MKVQISHEERKAGIFSKKTVYSVIHKVEFSPEEQAIIKARKLGDIVAWVAPDPRPGMEYAVKISYLASLKPTGFSIEFPTILEAKEYAEELKTKHFPNLKAYLTVSADVAKTESFEL